MRSLILAVLLLVPSLLFAQSAVPVVYTATSTHTGSTPTEYRLYMDGVYVASRPASDLVNGTITFNGTMTLTEGQHQAEISAVYPSGERKSVPKVFTVDRQESAPGSPIITITIT